MESRVKVLVRIRPPAPTETERTSVTVVDNQSVRLYDEEQSRYNNATLHTFDRCFGPDSTQEQIFDEEIRSSLDAVTNGINVAIFAYGNTGAGKTFTMQGSAEQPGVIPRAMRFLFTVVGGSCNVTASYLEIYNEKVFDLLVPKDRDLAVRGDPEHGIFVADLAEKSISSFAEFETLYAVGCRNRTTAATALNPDSSRSHSVLQIKITRRDENGRLLIGKLNMIDLAGSEDNRRTNNTGIRLTESGAINKSLFVLGKVVTAVNEKHTCIPYRDSKLTRFLQDSLGGRGVGIMIANVAPCANHFAHTYNTLNFANKSRQIVNRPVVHEQEVVKAEPAFRAPGARAAKFTKPTRTVSTTSLDRSADEVLAEIEERVTQQVQRALMSPMLRRHKVLDEETQSRLERLEEQLRATQQLPASVAIAEPAESEEEILERAKQTIVRAKAAAKAGNADEALDLYKQALLLVPDNVKLIDKVATLEAERVKALTQAIAEANAATPPESRGRKRKALAEVTNNTAPTPEESTPPLAKRRRLSGAAAVGPMKIECPTPMNNLKHSIEQDVLSTLNAGDVKALLTLNGIGKKRAQQIVMYRQVTAVGENGQHFASIGDLRFIPGFGEKLVSNFLKQNMLDRIQLDFT